MLQVQLLGYLRRLHDLRVRFILTSRLAARSRPFEHSTLGRYSLAIQSTGRRPHSLRSLPVAECCSERANTLAIRTVPRMPQPSRFMAETNGR
jgi:hypothetical protein